MLKKFLFISIFLTLLIFFIFLNGDIFNFSQVLAAETAAVQATIKISVCGNNVREADEVCDGTDLAGKTCQHFGYTQGNLACSIACDAFNTSGCYTPPPPPPPGGGGAPPVPETGASFSGRAYPSRTVTLLKDAQIVATTIAGTDATFSIRITGLTPGTYIFSLYSEDRQGIRSALLTFPLMITSGTITTVTGIFIAPSLDVDKSEVKRGENIAIFGQTAPQADLTIQISGSPDFSTKTVSDKDGIYLHYFNTAPLDYGTYYAKSSAALGGLMVSGFSRAVSFAVSTRTVMKAMPTILKGDLNKDGKVNLVDFSIAAYWYRRTLSPTMRETECERLNCDGIINLVDFSIMAFYWTG